VNEYYAELNIQFITQDIANNISDEELALIESVMSELILAMMQNNELDND